MPKEWADKYKGKFDQGWDKLREETFARQKQLGVIPANAKLTPRDPAFPAWDTLPPDREEALRPPDGGLRRLPGKLRLRDRPRVQSIDDLGLADNTLILYIWGDNGSSMEGTETGTFNELTMHNRHPL